MLVDHHFSCSTSSTFSLTMTGSLSSGTIFSISLSFFDAIKMLNLCVAALFDETHGKAQELAFHRAVKLVNDDRTILTR